MNTIICPHCKQEVEITSALDQQIRQDIMRESEEKHKKALILAQEEAKNEATKHTQEQFALQMKRTEEDLQAERQQKKLLIDQMEEITRELRNSKKERDEARLEMQKQLTLESEKIRADAQKKAEEALHTQLLEKDKQLADVTKELDDARRKAQQGSQQAQGEVFELEFEQLLARQYAHDKISPVGKGIKGGDIVQEVWDSNGNYAGKIIWELKNTKTWSEPWIDKLKGDKRAINADEAVIISEVLPANVKNAGFRNGVWVTQRNFVLPLTDSLRVKLIQLVIIKNSLKGKDMKMEALYSYLTGTEFKNRIEAIVEAFSSMQDEVEKEKRYFANKWARDEKNIRQVIDGTYGMHGDVKGILAAAMPQIAGMEMLEIEDGTVNRSSDS